MTAQQDWAKFSLERPNYFPGQYLIDTDFELAHRYLSDRQRYINSRLHLAGIVEGLEVEAIADQTEVTIKPGTAIDGEGNLVILTEAINRTINSVGWLCLRYHQQPTALQQPEIPDSFTRFEEIPSLTLEAIESNDAKTITLAQVSVEDGRVIIDQTVRQYSGLRLPSGSGDIALQSSDEALTINGSLSIAGALQIGETTITRISDEIDVTGRTDVIPSEKAVKDHIERRVREELEKKKAPKKVKQTIDVEPGPDGKLYGWKTEGGHVSDSSSFIKLIAYRAGEVLPRLSIERDTGTVEVNGRIRAPHIESANPMRHQMYPSDPIVYQDIFEARDKGAIQKHGEPESFNDTRHNTASNAWNGRRHICFGVKDPKNAGALITIPEGYDTAWVRVSGPQWYEYKADFIDGAKEDLGYWTAGFRQGNCYCPDGSLKDSYAREHEWLPIAAGRSGKLRLVEKIGTNGGGGLWLSGVAFSKNPWAHATQSAVGYYWGSNGGNKTAWNSASGESGGWNGDIFSWLESESHWELRVPYVWSGQDKLLYIIERNAESNGCNHGDITVNGQPIERLLATYSNPFSCHWNSKSYNRYIAARIPADLIPKPTAEYPPLLKVKFDRTKQNGRIHFREMGTHDLELPYYL